MMSRGVRLLLLNAGAVALASAGSTTTVLKPSANQVGLGQSPTLTATVSPPSATGKCTFYDGPVVLGISAVTAGSAVFKTNQLLPGTQSVTVRYDGDSGDAITISAPVSVTVQSAPELNFLAQPGLSANPEIAAAVADLKVCDPRRRSWLTQRGFAEPPL